MYNFLTQAAFFFDTVAKEDAKSSKSKPDAPDSSASPTHSGGKKKSGYDPNQERGKDGRWLETGAENDRDVLYKSKQIDPNTVDWNDVDTSPISRERYIKERIASTNGARYKRELEEAKAVKVKTKEAIAPEEMMALRMYTGDDFDPINRALRADGYRGMSESAEKTGQTKIEDAIVATAALNKLPNYKGTVYRGINLEDFEQYQALRPYRVGQTVTEKAFTSTSASTDNKFWREANVRFVINSKTGKKVEALSRKPAEQEVLFRPQTQYKVLSSSNADGIQTIHLDEVVKKKKK